MIFDLYVSNDTVSFLELVTVLNLSIILLILYRFLLMYFVLVTLHDILIKAAIRYNRS